MKKPQISTESSSCTLETIEKYRKLIAENPEIAELHADLGSIYARQQQWFKAIAAYQQAVKLNPQFAGAYRNLARVYQQIGEIEKAIDSWYEALKLQPDWADAQQHYSVGNALWKKQKIGKAISCYRQAIKLQPDFLPAYHNLGKILTVKEKLPQAIAVYRQAVAQNPNNPQFHFCLAQALAEKKQWKLAINAYKQVIELDENFAAAYYGLATVFAEQKKWVRASNFYQKAIKFQAKYWEAYHQLGIVLEKQEKCSEAISAYQNVIRLAPRFIPAYLKLGAIFRQQKQYQKASKFYRQAIELAPELSEIEQQAIAAYQETVYANPQADFKQYHHLATLLRSKSFFSEAISAYQKAIELNPEFLGAYYAIQYTHVAPEQLDKLIDFYRSIVEKHPHIDIAWGNLGDALAERGNIEEAINCYQTSCYQRTIAVYPHLAELDWKKPKQNAPEFIVIGAAKCGTSSLFNYLKSHPQILLPHKKELNFFGAKLKYSLDWYLAHFPSISDRPEFITGEATPNYIRFPQAATQIKAHFPKIKLIVLLRNPIDRSLSWHHHKLNSGLAKGTFAEAVAYEIKQLENFSEENFKKTIYHNPDNILGSLYLYKLKIWMKLFEREQFCIIKSEDLYSDPEKVMKRVFTFLGLENHSLSEYSKFNAGSYQPISDELRQTLADYFRPHNQKLEEYLDMKFDWE